MKRDNESVAGRGRHERMQALAGPLLGFLAAEPQRFDRFLALTGLTPAGLRAAAQDEGFAANLLAYLGSDERLLLAFAAEQGLAPALVAELAMGDAAPDEG